MASKQQQLDSIGLHIRQQQYQFARGLERVKAHPGVILHHMGEGAFTGDTRNPGTVVHRMHLANGWAGIGYHGIATQAGEYYTGRPYLHKGSHCPAGDGNQRFGLLWYGGTGDTPTTPALETLARAIAWVAVDQGWAPSRATIGYHGQFLSTACPGNLKAWYNWLVDRAGAIYRESLTAAAPADPGHIAAPKPRPDAIMLDIAGKTVQGIRRNGVAYVPARELAPLGVAVEYDKATDTVRLGKAAP